MGRTKKLLKKMQLSLMFGIVVFMILLLTLFLSFLLFLYFDSFGIPKSDQIEHFPLFWFAITSLIVGTILSILLSSLPLKPIREIMEAVDQVADGNYDVRLSIKGPDEFQQLGNKFNDMAKELSSVEMLRSDFVNNFSHEFKTPIVSIRGFAKMLKRNDLTVEERNEYLDIIISESERLTELATNVLNLSKIEQQTIVTDKKNVNVSEQIRLVIALLDNKWSEKHLNITFDCEEHFLYGNEEMLKQVWINLLDNAIKFTPEYGNIKIDMQTESEKHVIYFQNDTSNLSDDIIKHIFDKFYQGDTSHTTKGNGLGLTLVKKIVELHNGEIHVDNSNADTFIIKIIL